MRVGDVLTVLELEYKTSVSGGPQWSASGRSLDLTQRPWIFQSLMESRGGGGQAGGLEGREESNVDRYYCINSLVERLPTLSSRPFLLTNLRAWSYG